MRLITILIASIFISVNVFAQGKIIVRVGSGAGGGSGSTDTTKIPLSGTVVGKPITGDIEMASGNGNLSIKDIYPGKVSKMGFSDGSILLQNIESGFETSIKVETNSSITVKDEVNQIGLRGASDFSPNYDSLTYVQKKYVDKQLKDTAAAIRANGGGGGATYTFSPPLINTGGVVTPDTAKAAGKLATFTDVDIAKRWGISGNDIFNLNSGDVGIGTTPRLAGYLDLNRNLNVQGASASRYMRYIESLGRLIVQSNTVEPTVSIIKTVTGLSSFLEMQDQATGGYINFGSNGSNFTPFVQMSAGTSSNDFTGFLIVTRDVVNDAAFKIDARKNGGPLINQPLFSATTFGMEKFRVAADGRIMSTALKTTLTPPPTVGITNMKITDSLGNESFAPTVIIDQNSLAVTTPIKLRGYTVATLPVGTIGMTAFVTDATAPTYLGTLTGGGTTVCSVLYNGAAWVSH